MNQTSIVPAITTVIGALLSVLGVTGIDSGVVSQAVTGIIAWITLVTAIWTAVAHHKALKAAR